MAAKDLSGCNSTHDPPLYRRSLFGEGAQGEMEEGNATEGTSQTSNNSIQSKLVSEQPAVSTAGQFSGTDDSSRPDHTVDCSTELLLREMENITERFNQLELQAAEDRLKVATITSKLESLENRSKIHNIFVPTAYQQHQVWHSTTNNATGHTASILNTSSSVTPTNAQWAISPGLGRQVVTSSAVQIPSSQVGAVSQHTSLAFPSSHMTRSSAHKHIFPSQQASADGEDGNTIIPSFQSMRITQAAYQNVNKWNQKLDVSVEGRQKVKWPQHLVSEGSLRKRPTYDQLTTCQWLLGFLRIRQEEQDPAIRENMVEYLTELLQDACDFSWDAAKGAHSVLLHKMQDGVLSWDNLEEVHKIRKCYTQTSPT